VVRTTDRKICVPYDVIHADFDSRNVERIEPAGQKTGQEEMTMVTKSKRRKIKVAPTIRQIT
jgi:hypothetical protein